MCVCIYAAVADLVSPAVHTDRALLCVCVSIEFFGRRLDRNGNLAKGFSAAGRFLFGCIKKEANREEEKKQKDIFGQKHKSTNYHVQFFSSSQPWKWISCVFRNDTGRSSGQMASNYLWLQISRRRGQSFRSFILESWGGGSCLVEIFWKNGRFFFLYSFPYFDVKGWFFPNEMLSPIGLEL